MRIWLAILIVCLYVLLFVESLFNLIFGGLADFLVKGE